MSTVLESNLERTINGRVIKKVYGSCASCRTHIDLFVPTDDSRLDGESFRTDIRPPSARTLPKANDIQERPRTIGPNRCDRCRWNALIASTRSSFITRTTERDRAEREVARLRGLGSAIGDTLANVLTSIIVDPKSAGSVDVAKDRIIIEAELERFGQSTDIYAAKMTAALKVLLAKYPKSESSGLFPVGPTIRVSAGARTRLDDVLWGLADRHQAGDFGQCGTAADLNLDSDGRWCPHAVGQPAPNLAAIESRSGIIESRYEQDFRVATWLHNSQSETVVWKSSEGGL